MAEIETDNAFLQVADEFHMNYAERFVLAGIVMLGSVDFDSEEWIAFSKFIGEEESAKYTNAIKRLVELGYAAAGTAEGGSMITKCPFHCIVKSPYGTCVAGRCMNSEYRSLWDGNKLDPRKLRQYQGQTKPPMEAST